MANIKAEKMTVVMQDKETGETYVLPGAVGSLEIDDFKPEPTGAGRYSFQAKAVCRTRITRKMRKNFRRVFYTPRQRKYWCKAILCEAILQLDKGMTADELRTYTHRQLMGILLYNLTLHIMLYGRKSTEHKLDGLAKGGIVPKPEYVDNIRRDETVITPDQQNDLRRILVDSAPEQKPLLKLDMRGIKNN